MANSMDKTGNTVSTRKKQGLVWSLKNTSFGESRSYLFEYGLLLALTAGLLYVILNMVQAFYKTVEVSLPIISVSDSEVFLLSALTVILPLVIILIQRTAESESSNPSIKNLPWRKAFLGIFLSVVSITAVISSILFISSVLEYLSNGMIAVADFNWQEALMYLIVSSLFIVTAWTYGNDYRYVSRDHFASLRHVYRYGLVFVALVVGLLFLVFPFRENRTAYIDQGIVTDLQNIKVDIDSFASQNGRLPNSFTELNFDTEKQQRASAYNYAYEIKTDTTYSLCADFSADGTVTSGKAYESVAATLEDHTAGINCFDFTSATISSSQNLEDVTFESIY